VTEGPAERVRVTGPARRSGGGQPRTREIDDDTALGTVLMRSLLRAQLRLAAQILVPLAIVAGGLPLLFHLAPGLAEVRLLGIPLPWVALGGLIYPFLCLLGWSYVRRAERNEQDFAELVDIVDRP
jgi:hypothetical protein